MKGSGKQPSAKPLRGCHRLFQRSQPSLLRHFELIRNEIENENHRQFEYFNGLLEIGFA